MLLEGAASGPARPDQGGPCGYPPCRPRGSSRRGWCKFSDSPTAVLVLNTSSCAKGGACAGPVDCSAIKVIAKDDPPKTLVDLHIPALDFSSTVR